MPHHNTRTGASTSQDNDEASGIETRLFTLLFYSKQLKGFMLQRVTYLFYMSCIPQDNPSLLEKQ